jgi:hypothetical protein
MSRLKVSALAPALVAALAMVAATGFAKERAPKPIEKGASIGVVNLMNAEVMHYHAAKDSNGSFWKMRAVQWPVDDMLMEALKERAEQLGLTLKQLAPTEALERARESCFVNAALADGKLPKQCSAPLTEQASSAGVSYLIVMAPGLNDANHAGAARFENVSAMMRGWSFLTRERAGPKDKPTLYNEVEMLFINVSPQGVTLRARQWGGIYTTQWQTFTMPADPHEIAAEQLNELQPLYAAMQSRQAKSLLDQIQVEP